MEIQELFNVYSQIHREIQFRLLEFRTNFHNLESIECQLIFCLCTPQTDAHKGWRAATALVNLPNDLQTTESILYEAGVRFHRTKAKRIVIARSLDISKLKETLIKTISSNGIVSTRNWLREEINGFGYKEASHFLRNLGFGTDVAILDRHILRRLVDLNVIPNIPKLSRKNYLEVERKMKDFAYINNIPIEALDLVFWYISKGEIFR